ncbi:hypothetical protein PhCBS80983_g03126 [Powellomyces hirtus]|uniref:Peptidase S8/S53 domain-containing protein n=1 Tax=Powellomyces hirtus TaxID=109895 RepID=A0A507E3M5_9FUNG|nr:serine protease [Powellomyces hirtus]TPX58434.1 hypothetical protein PhCBS80983_g03126 [Powellomyces hirtus]
MVRLTTLVCLALASFASATPIVKRAAPGTAIDGQYIVTFKKSTSFAPRDVDAMIGNLLGAPKGLKAGPAPGLLQKYDFGSDFQGFAAKISDEATLERIKANSEVLAIEEDAIITIDGTQTGLPTGLWGLDAIDGKVDRTFTYPDAAGAGVDAYIVDTGCNTAHVDFEGRAKWGASFTGETSRTDGNGHGTHVAGTVGGRTYGVAKKVNLICVRVLSATGSGSTSGVVAGMNWVVSQARASGRKSVANMSLGGGKATSIDQAATAMVNAGVALAVAAGNDETIDACNQSPAGATGPLTVAASDSGNRIATFSSTGRCVEIIAPGVNILSAWKGSSTATSTISGTSMASPHVAGALAVAYSTQSFSSPAQAYAFLLNKAKKNAITRVPAGTTNTFLQL